MKRREQASLFHRFFIPFSLVAGLIWIFSLFVSYQNARLSLRDNLISSTNSKSIILGASIMEPIKSINFNFIRRQCEHAMATTEFSSIKIFDGSRNLIHQCFFDNLRRPTFVDQFFIDIVNLPENYSHTIRDENNAVWGHIESSINVSKAADAIRNIIVPQALIVAGFLLLILGASYNLITRESRALQELARSVRNAASNIDQSSETPQELTVAGLSSESGQIQRRINQLLKKINDLRREVSIKSKLAAMGQTVTMVAHDVRKPFAMLEVFIEQLCQKGRHSKQQKEMLDDLRRMKKHTNQMLDDLLEFGSERDEWQRQLAPCNPQSLIVSNIRESLKSFSSVNIAFKYDLQHSHMVRVDLTSVSRVFLNILVNAIEAMEGVGTIRFMTNDQEEGEGRAVRFSIHNSNSYIPEEIRTEIFNPFFTRGKAKGTGLGLAICYKIITDHRGSIEVESDRSAGTTFHFTLPAAEEASEFKKGELIYHSSEISHSVLADPDGKEREALLHAMKGAPYPYTVLIVDDEPLFRVSLRSQLYDLGLDQDSMAVVEASSGEEALAIFEQTRVDYVIADVMMGEDKLDGFEFTQLLFEKYPRKPVVIHSNLNSPYLYERAQEAGAVGFLPKPMSKMELLRFLAQNYDIVFKARQVEMPLKTEERAPSGKLSVAVLDDEPIMREGYTMILKNLVKKQPNVEVRCFEKSEDMYSYLSGSEEAILFTDLNLEDDDDGFIVSRTVRERFPHTRIIMVTNSHPPQLVRLAEVEGIEEVIDAPLTEECAKRILRHWV